MKNMKVAKKLVVGFTIVCIIAAAIGAVGIFGIWSVNDASTKLYKQNTAPMADMSTILVDLQRQRIIMREMVLYTGDTEKLAELDTQNKAIVEEFEVALEAFDATFTDVESQTLYDEAKSTYYSVYQPTMDKVMQGALNGDDQETLLSFVSGATSDMDKMAENFTQVMNNKINQAAEADQFTTDTFYRLLIVIIAVTIAAIVISMLLALNISKMISKPLNFMKDVLQQIGTEGNLSFSDEVMAQAKEIADGKDEVAQSTEMLVVTLGRLMAVGDALDRVAGGDLTTELVPLGDKDTMGVALARMLGNLNQMFGDIRTVAVQVSAGAGQVSHGAQALAAGSTQQATSIQEFSDTLSELQQKTDDNVKNTERAQTVTSQAESMVKESIQYMGEMLGAMKAIDESSQSITKIIKVIDDIAFQTNILALNAAVEAARAGTAGLGFAVVADEVRNLASKSATAAKETALLIEGSTNKVTEGNKIVEMTNESLEAVVNNARESVEVIKEVTDASHKQARAIDEINTGIEQISIVVQSNAATSQESAASAQEMSAQSTTLNDIIHRFKLKE